MGVPNYRVLNSCPAYCYKVSYFFSPTQLEDKPPLEFSHMWIANRNNSLKCMAGVRGHATGDKDQDEEWKDEGHQEKCLKDPQRSSKILKDPQRHLKEPREFRQPKDTMELEIVMQSNSVQKTEKQLHWTLKRGCGMSSRNPEFFVEWQIVFGPKWPIGYDIGCNFGRTITNSSLEEEFKAQECCTCVNAFHGYSHNAISQQSNHSLNITGMGLEDFEIIEWLFSSSN
ncbi:hypothetical protein F5880DRAFT_1509603 [Lentinula raphanica]|nr:hypothetical protein F5880DRAFT_1509603 [Lentinula raphanica]